MRGSYSICTRLERTTIILQRNTREKLKQLGKKNQTYDQIIADLISKQILNPVVGNFGNIQSDNSRNIEDIFVQPSCNNVHDVSNHICEAVNCNAEATTEIRIDTGQSESITLSLCGKCVGKFTDQSHPDKSGE
jgi:hypothetical protein